VIYVEKFRGDRCRQSQQRHPRLCSLLPRRPATALVEKPSKIYISTVVLLRKPLLKICDFNGNFFRKMYVEINFYKKGLLRKRKEIIFIVNFLSFSNDLV
jgi:hypothetical protein